MGVGDDFKSFCSNLTIPLETRKTIGDRYQLITKRLNLDFWSLDSNKDHSFYAGSYGRGTATRGFSDLDMIFRLPYGVYEKYNNYVYNGQSALLQEVRKSLQKTYSTTSIGGDGQVVAISFTDGITFEIVPAFVNKDGSYTYPDSNDGGRWRVTNPKPEIESFMDSTVNGNLKWLCRMMRVWKNKWSVPMGGLLIDTLAYRFLRDWPDKDKSFLYYDWMTRDFLNFLSEENFRDYWLAVGSSQYIFRKGDFQHKAKRCYNISVEAINHATAGNTWSSKQKWREIYGSYYPA